MDIIKAVKMRKLKKLLGKDKKIEWGGYIEVSNPQNIHLSDYCYIGPNCKLYGSGNLYIEENVIIGNDVCILTTNHNYEGEMLPYDSKAVNKDVHIGKNTWIASFVFILPGVTIGEGAVIAGGSVVVKDVPPLAIVGGNPAKIIKYRNESRYRKLKEENRLYVPNKF